MRRKRLIDRMVWHAWLCSWLVSGAGLLAGCASPDRPRIERALSPPAPRPVGSDPQVGIQSQAAYPIACPDRLRVQVVGRPEVSGPHTVGPDGRIDLGPLGRPRVEGATAAESARLVAECVGLPPERVAVEVTAHRGHQVYLFGQIRGGPRAIPYRGPETVVELLQRTGGLEPGAALNAVQVVRAHVAEGHRPEVYQVDLHAIVVGHDPRTDLHLQPYDQIYVGATRRASLVAVTPPWLQPVMRTVCGLLPWSKQAPAPAVEATPGSPPRVAGR